MSLIKFGASLYLKSRNMLISISRCKEPQLMQKVIIKGENGSFNKYGFINNMTRRDSEGNTLYTICTNMIVNGKRESLNLTRDRFKICITRYNIKRALLAYYEWWKMYWYKSQLDALTLKLNKIFL